VTPLQFGSASGVAAGVPLTVLRQRTGDVQEQLPGGLLRPTATQQLATVAGDVKNGFTAELSVRVNT
jgi:hypothetical protein